MKEVLFDTHVHFFDSRFANYQTESMILDAQRNQIGYFCNVGIDLETSQKALQTALKYPFVFAACGFHPTMVNSWNDQSFLALSQLLTNPKVLAVGEIGLDFYHQYTTPALQKEIFIKQLCLAQKVKKPVLLHIRNAYSAVLAVLPKHPVQGIVHCFSGTLTQAQQFIKLGFLISFSGTLTFKNALDLQTTAKSLPLEKIVLETDAPYLAPMPFRGQTNLPKYLLSTAKKLAELKNLPLAKVVSQTTANALSVLKIVVN